jgi:glycosyltransferase involved in cell wall biosynthesis
VDTFQVTVVIPCYNHGLWLTDAIKSVYAQTYQPIELVIVDDGSTDNTAAICKKWPNLRYIWQENTGLAAARNAGLAVASGTMICFLDADDLLIQDAIERGVDALKTNPDWAFVYGGCTMIDINGKPFTEFTPHRDHANYRCLLQANRIPNPGTVLYRRDVLREVGGFRIYSAGGGRCEDYDLYLRIAYGHTIGCHQHLVAEYRIHGNNMSCDNARMLEAVLAVLADQKEAVHNRIADRIALRKGIWHYYSFYGGPIIRSALRGFLDSKHRWDSLRRLRNVFRIAPGAFLVSAVTGIKARLRKVGLMQLRIK